MATPERWLSVSEAGRALGLSRTSLLAAEEAGLLASLRTPGGHRRYRPAELRRYLRAAGAAGAWPAQEPAGPEAAADPVVRRISALDVATALRAALRPVTRALAAECAGVYLVEDGVLRFCTAFGIPRWLAERLAVADAPAAVRHARDAHKVQRFDPAAEAFPEPRSSGSGIAVALRTGEQPLGVLFAVLPPEAPVEPRAVESFAELITQAAATQARISELEGRLAAIADLVAFPGP